MDQLSIPIISIFKIRIPISRLHVVSRPASARPGAYTSGQVSADASVQGSPGGSHNTMFIDSDPGLVIFL